MTNMFSATSDGLVGVAILVPYIRLGSLRIHDGDTEDNVD